MAHDETQHSRGDRSSVHGSVFVQNEASNGQREDDTKMHSIRRRKSLSRLCTQRSLAHTREVDEKGRGCRSGTVTGIGTFPPKFSFVVLMALKRRSTDIGQ